MRIVVFGASGFIGSAVLRAVAAAGAERVVAAIRRPDERLAAMRVETRLCDATDPSAVTAAFEGMTHAVNSVMGSAETLDKATRNIGEAAVACRLERLVHLSSIAVYGDATGVVTEGATPGQKLNAYGRAKLDCERLLHKLAGRGLTSVILRPSCVYGPNSDLWTGRIGRLLAARRLGDLGADGDGACNLINIADLAAAVVAALSVPVDGTEAFNISDPDPPSWNSYLMQFAGQIGATPVERIGARQLWYESHIFAPPLKALQIASRTSRRFVKLVPDPVTPSLVRLFRQAVRFDHAKADARLGFARTPFETGLAEAATWFVDWEQQRLRPSARS
jgi:nucleoside-diphosphate-sugar epimerase